MAYLKAKSFLWIKIRRKKTGLKNLYPVKK
jgi:hypothetical protein